MLTLRRACLGDADALLRWRNDPLTRAASHTPDVVLPEQHIAWLQGLLLDRRRQLWIAEEGGVALGSVRADLIDGAYLLSWMLAPEARGKGHGTQMLRSLLAQLGEAVVRAEIKDDNVASWRMAEALGFQCIKNAEGIRHYIR